MGKDEYIDYRRNENILQKRVKEDIGPTHTKKP